MTKIATVVVITCEGHGGIFFYKERIVPKIKSVKEKLYTETQDSLEAAGEIMPHIHPRRRRQFKERENLEPDSGNHRMGTDVRI